MNQARVSRVTLAAPDEVLIRRGAVLLEDAMNVATLHAATDRRHYIVRHFDVGVIDADAPPQTLALQIERRLAHVRLTAVPATSPSGATARAVYFPDDVTAIAELARRIAAGPPPREWFWPHVVSGAVKQPPARALAACLAAAAALPAGPLAIAEVVAAVETAREGALLATLQPGDAIPLLRLTFGVTSPLEPAAAASSTALASSGLPPVWRARLARWIARWNGDARAHWLVAVAMVHARRTVRRAETELATAASIVAAELQGAARELALGEPTREDEREPAAVLDSSNEAPRLRPRIVVEDVESAVPVTAEPVEMAANSAVAGALLAIRPLTALGMAAWLDDHEWAAASGFAARVLAMLAASQLTDPLAGDPLVDALGGGRAADGPFVAPAIWRALLGVRPAILRRTGDHGRVLFANRIPIAAWRGRRTSALPWSPRHVKRGAPVEDRGWAFAGWHAMLGRWLRRYTGVSLAELIGRPGQLAATSTHLEVTWPLRTVDVRIRAAGLDVDPGWVPWLGRVVTFRYVEEDAR
jgi:hypothetical protein